MTTQIQESSFIERGPTSTLIVSEWGRNSVRIQCIPKGTVDNPNIRIDELQKNPPSNVVISQDETGITLVNQQLKVKYDGQKLTFYNGARKVLEEYSRQQSDVRRTTGVDEDLPIEEGPSFSLNKNPREFIKNNDETFRAELKFEGDPNEKIFGLGAYQEEGLDKNLGSYELLQRNSQTTIPYYLSDKGYSFIWNDASVGSVTFSKNVKKWSSQKTTGIDYIISVGENPKELTQQLTQMVGRAPNMPRQLTGLWQSKLRYQTLEEVETVYEAYLKRDILPSVLVIDYFHWTNDGDYQFDIRYWSGISSFAKGIEKTRTSLMVSLWPTISKESKYYSQYSKEGLLIHSKDGSSEIFDNKEILDFSNPSSAKFLQYLLDKNYRKNGIKLFWADQAEPEMTRYVPEKYEIYAGNMASVGAKYPLYYLKAIQANGFKSENEEVNPVLIRSAWFNSQKYGSLAWSGDIESSFDSLRRQIQIAMSMGLSGVSWWTNDIGGFHSGNSQTDDFKELIIRWFQFATFSPILRMHGDRQPHTQRIGKDGGGVRTSGGPNEIWSFGPNVEKILTRYIQIREKLSNYISQIFVQAHQMGYPLIRPLFFEFPEDELSWSDSTNYMFGDSLLVVPIVHSGRKKITVYLPKGADWIAANSGIRYSGGSEYQITVTIDDIPIFCRTDADNVEDLVRVFKKS